LSAQSPGDRSRRLRVPARALLDSLMPSRCRAGEQKLGYPRFVEQSLVAARQGRSYLLAICWSVPVVGGSHRACICGETNQNGVATVALAYELSDIQLAARTHFRRPCIAQVRVVLPHDDLCLPSMPTEMTIERFERLEHVAVAQVPGGHAPAKHGAVVLFRVLDQP